MAQLLQALNVSASDLIRRAQDGVPMTGLERVTARLVSAAGSGAVEGCARRILGALANRQAVADAQADIESEHDSE